ncbi:TetR/AcrR family transcriptional regulator C-terminal domain-containing protein [Peribacillus sp. NPDC076916]|uniref:TetR/AcrR family transcriptional regulator C-terminal domain-containing protein n=1 Tax=Peribacillus sp. NPDC076916 TaxID=3390608 RepID=UPI003D032D6D
MSQDLFLISRKYHEIMNHNRKLIQIGMKEQANLPGLHEKMKKQPQQLLMILSNYLRRMSEKGKVIRSNPELQALSFMIMHFGAYMDEIESNADFPSLSLDDFIKESVTLFIRALTP